MMTQLEIWAPPLLIWAVNLIKIKYLDAEIGYEVGTGICHQSLDLSLL